MPTFRSETRLLQIGDGSATVRSAMDGDRDGNRSERSRVRENKEGVGLFRDRFKTCEGKTKTKAVQ